MVVVVVVVSVLINIIFIHSYTHSHIVSFKLFHTVSSYHQVRRIFSPAPFLVDSIAAREPLAPPPGQIGRRDWSTAGVGVSGSCRAVQGKTEQAAVGERVVRRCSDALNAVNHNN